ncbi:YopX family protein [Enterococcus faecalis]|uniref:YopX family protein n=1 Tax=Enterococcus faecalis TaxID=1351 RepID=UPI001F583FA1|nr:YopX family protein [Enterococcus faecalis]
MIPKFRAWDKNTNDMVDVKTIDLEKDGSIGCIVDYNGINLDVSECILMQSTGLKDLNGVEIFEGDIVSVRNHPFQKTESSVGIEIDGDYKVSWNEYDLTWCAGNLLLARIKPYVTVIGNIHENPELLEGTE